MKHFIRLLLDPSFGAQLGGQFAQAAAGAIFGAALAPGQDRRQRRQARKLQAIQIEGMKDMGQWNFEKQLEMWEKTGYGAQVDQLKRAGLNPALLYGHGGPGGTTNIETQGTGGGAGAPSGGGELLMGAGMGIQSGLAAAQLELMKAQAKKTNVEADKIAGVDTEKTKAETGLLKLDKSFYEQTFDTRIQELTTAIEKVKQEARKLDQDTGITADTRKATVAKAEAEALGAVLENLLIGAKTNATIQEVEESKARMNQISGQLTKWTEEIKQGWYGLSLKQKELRLEAIMKEVETVTMKKSLTDLPALTPNQRRQVIRQIDKIAEIGTEDYQ